VHVVEHVAVEGPVAAFEREIERHLPAGKHVDGVFLGVTNRPVNEFEDGPCRWIDASSWSRSRA
jgi:hypothetical protein